MIPRYLTNAEAEKVYTPLHVPADSVQFRPMNVVIIILESFNVFIGALLPKKSPIKASPRATKKGIERMETGRGV